MNPMKPSQPIASICLTEWKDESDVPFLYDTTNEDATWKQKGTTSVTWRLGNVDTRALMDR